MMSNKRLSAFRVGAFLISFLGLLMFDRAYAATITVNSLNDPGSSGSCALRDAITAANMMTATNGCVAGTGTDTINFNTGDGITLVGGTLGIGNTLPTITTTLTIDGIGQNITISGNKTVSVMFVGRGATLNLNHLTIADGRTLNHIGGGGIASNGTLTVTNSTFSNNSAPNGSGGGIFNNDTMTVTNSTFSGNSAAQGGGGIANFFTANLKGTILAASTSGGNCAGANIGGFDITDQGYNISSDTTCGFAATGSAKNGDGVDPKLSTAGLASNGGPTQTIALLAGSPAIDVIPVADCTDQSSPPNPITTDQRGFPRPDAGEAVCDIGAYESGSFAGKPGAANCQGVSDSALSNQFGTLGAAASALGFPNVTVLQSAIMAFCAR